MCGRDRTVGDRRIEHAYVFDRLGDERLTQAYRILTNSPTPPLLEAHVGGPGVWSGRRHAR